MLHSVTSPFLSTGLTAAVFQIDEKTLSFKQRLKKRVKWTEITSFAAINNLLCIKSGPVALLVLRSLIISLTPDSVNLNIIHLFHSREMCHAADRPRVLRWLVRRKSHYVCLSFVYLYK